MISTEIELQYARIISILTQTCITTHLPQSGKQGVIGIDGIEYPTPTYEQLETICTCNEELVIRKMDQGFTQLQFTPLAMPIPQLLERIETAIRKHAAAGNIFDTKQNAADADSPVRVNIGEPIWIWAQVLQALDTPDMVYFPRIYTDRDHQGLSKVEVIKDPRYCAVPGWSVGYIEPIQMMPQQRKGQVIAGRQQLEGYAAPQDYLNTLETATYDGETGWTPEDFLTYFITQLETTNQVSHARKYSNALWLLGSYLPNLMPKARLVPVGYWAHRGGRLHLTAHRTGNRLKDWAARSMVRLNI